MLKRSLSLVSLGPFLLLPRAYSQSHPDAPPPSPPIAEKTASAQSSPDTLHRKGFDDLGGRLRCRPGASYGFALRATTVKVIFNLSFTLTAPPPTFTGVMP